MQISVSASISYGLERLRTIFHKTLRTARKCGRLDACCLRQSGSRHTILEMSEFRFWQFPNGACHVFPQIVTKIRTDLKLICIDFISSINKTGIRKVQHADTLEIETDFRDVQNPILAVSRLWWTYFPTEECQFWPFRGCI